MKLMIASDVHGSAHFGRLLLDALDREQADRLLLLGDLLYHGPRNDLPQGYDPKALTAMLNDARGRLLCVRGNCDAEVDQMVLQFPILADYCVLPCGERLIYATHGHVYNLQQLPPLQPGDILLHGCITRDATGIILNTGSTTRSDRRRGNARCRRYRCRGDMWQRC